MSRFISFNVNGIRARPHQIEAILDIYQPDVIGLQETKVDDVQFPIAWLKALGLEVSYFGQKSHYGVALLSRTAPSMIQKGFPNEPADAQRRFIHARYELNGRSYDVLNGYFPQGESRDHPTKFPMKAAYYAALTDYVQTLLAQGRSVVLMGDMNIAPADLDIGIGEKNAQRWLKTGKCSFLPEEREWYAKLMQLGLTDTYRIHHPDADDLFSWFDYRSGGFNDEPKRGLRIDHILCSADLVPHCQQAGISYEVRAMDKPSDHAPVWAVFA